MRSLISASVVALVLAVVPTPSHAESAVSGPSDKAVTGLVVKFGAWGPLKVGMTNKQAQKTGMVSTKADQCAPGYQMQKRFQHRGYVVWKGQFPTMTVDRIIITGSKEHTTQKIHVGSTLRQLRHAYPSLSKVYSSGAITGQPQSGPNDLYVAYIHKAHRGTLGFQFAYGPKPKPTSKIAMIIIATKRTVYWGC